MLNRTNNLINTSQFAILIQINCEYNREELITEKIKMTRQPIMCILMSVLKTNTLLLKQIELTTKDIKINKQTSKYKLLH